MSKWVAEFLRAQIGRSKDIDQLTQNGKLNNGKEISYALGIVNDKWNGWRQYSHSGGDAGYRTYVSVFPDLKMGFIVFSNLGDFNPADGVYEMAGLFIKDTAAKAVSSKAPARQCCRLAERYRLPETFCRRLYR